jgi:hypothetical protein
LLRAVAETFAGFVILPTQPKMAQVMATRVSRRRSTFGTAGVDVSGHRESPYQCPSGRALKFNETLPEGGD